MKQLDRFLQEWRFRAASPWIPDGARVLDIGCHEGELFKRIGHRLGASVGIDPLARDFALDNWRCYRFEFSDRLPYEPRAFDCITMLATLEHIPQKDVLARECNRVLELEGRVVMTVPSQLVDRILKGLIRLRLVEGMSLDQHHGFDPANTPHTFAKEGFGLIHSRRFQFGLNNLFVFNRRW